MASLSVAGAPAAARYPSADPGFEVLPLESLLSEREALLGRIKLCYGADRPTFEQDLMPLVRGYAAYVHLLPATADNYFCAPGGLLQLGLETAFFSLQGTDAHIFSGRATISARRELEPRWRIATFVGGLCCELHRVLSHLIVATPNGDEWPAFLTPLTAWARQMDCDRYFVRWRPHAAESRGLGLFALPLVVPPATLQALCHEDGAIVRQLLASVGGVPQYREHNVLDELVRRSLALVIDRNLLANADRYGAPQYGSHLERYLVDALRRLAAAHSAWVPNRDKARLWYGQDGLYMAWPSAAHDVIELLEGDQLAGIPKSPATLLDLLLACGALQAMPDRTSIWHILPPSAKAGIDAVKLASPAIVLAGIEPAPEPLPCVLHRASPFESPTQAVQAPARPVPASPAKLPERPAQLSLIDPESADAALAAAATAALPPPEQPAMPAAPAASIAPDPRPIRLKAPMRLNPAVRSALADAIDSLNDPPGQSPVFTVAEGVFVALSEFELRGIQPTVAMRALADAAMLVKPPHAGPPTHSRDIQGSPVVGVVVSVAHLEGLDPAAFRASEQGIH